MKLLRKNKTKGFLGILKLVLHHFLLYIWSIKNEYLENSMKNYFPFYLFIWNFFFVFNFINGIEKKS